MEEQIYQILFDKIGGHQIDSMNSAAKEIAEHFERFMEWYIWGNHPFCGWYENATDKFISDEVSDKKWTISELFNHWNEHINNEK